MYLKYKYKVKKCTWSTDKSTLSISNRSTFVSTRWCYVRELRSSCMRWMHLSAACQHQWLIRTGHRYFSDYVNHSMGPALIGQDSVDFTPGTCSITLSVIGDDVFSFRNRYSTLSSLSTSNTQHCHMTYKIGDDTFRVIYAGCVCVFSPHGPVANKFCCPARYFYYVWTCLNLSNC